MQFLDQSGDNSWTSWTRLFVRVFVGQCVSTSNPSNPIVGVRWGTSCPRVRTLHGSSRSVQATKERRATRACGHCRSAKNGAETTAGPRAVQFTAPRLNGITTRLKPATRGCKPEATRYRAAYQWSVSLRICEGYRASVAAPLPSATKG